MNMDPSNSSDTTNTDHTGLDKLTITRGIGTSSKDIVPKKLLFQQDERLSHELAVRRRKKKLETNDTVESDRHK